MKKSVFLAHIREAAQQQGKALEELLKQTREQGYEALECDYTEIVSDARGFGRMLASFGFAVSCVCCRLDFSKGVTAGDIRQVIDNVVAVGSKKLLMIPEYLSSPDAPIPDVMVEGVAAVCAEAEKAGVIVGMENYESPLSPCATAENLKYFFDRIPTLKFMLDTGNFMFMGADVLECSRPLMDRFVHVHLKDRSLQPLNPEDRFLTGVEGIPLYPSPIGSGVIPMKEVLDMVKATGYDDYCTVEHFCAADQFDYAVKSLNWLEANW